MHEITGIITLPVGCLETYMHLGITRFYLSNFVSLSKRACTTCIIIRMINSKRNESNFDFI